jgi:hypothetical protein
MKLSKYVVLLPLVAMVAWISPAAWADDAPASDQPQTEQPAGESTVAAEAGSSESSSSSNGGSSDEKPKYPPYSSVLKDMKRVNGLVTLHYNDTKMLAELKPSDLNTDFFVLITIAKGIGQRPILGGYSWGFGDDWVWQFRKLGDRLQIVRRNVRFTADKNSPSEKAVKLLFSLPIATQGPGGSLVVDMTPVFMSDLPQIDQALPGFVFSPSKSSWAEVNGFDKNVELQVAATYASKGTSYIETVPDTRGVTINVHYSISKLPKTSYRPRLADDRVGYFLTAVKDFSKAENEDQFVRYINRWHLEKSEPDAEISPPKQPIVFWLEKTVPFKYRKPIRDGIAEWNRAFEKAGYYDAIDVRQQPDDATWEPGDVNYNTFRWITSNAGFAMGPSRVDPTTGQILDADIIFDADFVQVWKREYETFTPKGIEALTGGPHTIEGYHAAQQQLPAWARQHSHANCACNLLGGMSRQFALGATVSAARKRSPQELDKIIMQGLKEVTMHEVGHTLGLRHNFKASTLYSIEEMQDVEKTSKTGLTASVMDYAPVNLMPGDMKQGDYYSTTIGPYDYWAIEYGYTPIKASTTEGELEALGKIAAKSGDPQLVYLTDEDTRPIDPDPHSYRFDMSNNLVEYAEVQAKLVAEALPGVVEQSVEDGEGYQKARRAFGVLLSTHGTAMYQASRYIGGVYVSRSHKGDDGAKPPFEVVEADRQRDTLKLLTEQVFSDKPFNFPTELYNQLAASHWDHWGSDVPDRADYPAHEVILMWQERILSRVLSPLTLTRVHDSELKVAADGDAFTTVELLQGLTNSIFGELAPAEGKFSDRQPAISSLRRNLQRSYIKQLSNLSLGRTSAPQDCQTVAFGELDRLKTKIDAYLEKSGELDTYTRSHLKETSARIAKVLEATVTMTP